MRKKAKVDKKDQTTDQRIGCRIAEAREMAGVNQGVLAKDVLITQNQLHKYERGKCKCNEQLVVNIAEKLNVSPYALLDPVPRDAISIMHTLFRIEEVNEIDPDFSMEIVRGGFYDDETYVAVRFSNPELNNYLRIWAEKLKSLRMFQLLGDKEAELSYKKWKMGFPNSDNEAKNISKDKLRDELQQRNVKLNKERDKIDTELKEIAKLLTQMDSE